MFAKLVKPCLLLIRPAIAIILAGDLLFLYFSGVWHDPIKLIEYSEVVLLFLLIPFFGYDLIKKIKKVANE